MHGQPGELDSYRGEGGTVYPFYTANEQSFDDDDTPPPTPMWSNLPPPAPPETASRWKAVRKQISVAGRFWSAGQDRAEEAAVSALSELLQGLVAQGALSLERRLVEHRDTPPGAVWPHGWPPRYTQRVLQLPLTEASVLDLVADLSAGALPPLQYVAGLLHAAKASLAQLPNVLRHDVPTGCAVTVVGDLHGQFGDLLHVLRSRGFPSPTRPFVFNGDFVDRGPASVEVALTLFAFQLLLPNSVFLNRGNHEERSVHALYGFQRECNAKYAPDAGGAAAYELFSEAFEHLPLATLLNGKVLVLHGGVDDEMTLEQLERLPRKEYAVNQANLLGTGRPGLVHPHMRARLAEIAAREKELRPINSALWNDPCAEPGVYPNRYRGTGLLFGADVAAGFLERSGLGLILRSHEQVPEGFHWPYGPGRHLATVFSASNYAGKTLNKGAYALLGATGSRLSDPALSPLPLDAAPGAAAPAASPAAEEEGATAEHPFGGLRFVSFDAEELPRLRVSQRRHQLVASAVLAQRDELLAAYQAADRGATGELPVDVWEEETRRVLRTPPMLLPPMRCFLLGRDWGGSPTVRYQAFLGRFRLAVPQLAPLLPYRDYLVLLLANLDAKRSGAVSSRQFAAACKALHSQFGAAAALCAKPEEVLAAMGMAAGRGSREGSVAIRSVAAQLCVLVAGCPGAGSTSLSGFLSRLSTDEILLAAQPSPETPRGGSAGEAGDSSSAPMEEEDGGAEEAGDGRSISPPRRSSSSTMVSSRDDLMSDG